MVYVLGFFIADGTMIKNKRGAHFIEFDTIDKELLWKIRKSLKSNHKISVRNRSDKWATSYRLQIGSKVMFGDLMNLGFFPNKSKRINLPDILPKLICHFVRGYFDGDGHVSIAKYRRKDRNNKEALTIISGFTSCAKEFLKNLHSKLKSSANVVGGSLFYSKGYRLSFSVKDSLALYKFLYRIKDNNFYLKRKKIIFEKYFNMDP